MENSEEQLIGLIIDSEGHIDWLLLKNLLGKYSKKELYKLVSIMRNNEEEQILRAVLNSLIFDNFQYSKIMQNFNITEQQLLVIINDFIFQIVKDNKRLTYENYR